MYSKALRNKLTQLAKAYADANNLTYNNNLSSQPESALIFDETASNFHPHSWNVITQNDNFLTRTKKTHSSFEVGASKEEMQSSNSSDALLMNIFCHPKINEWKGVKQLLHLNNLANIQFGHQPGLALQGNEKDRTEIDLFIEDKGKKVFCESKLTETDFGFQPLEKFQRYKHFNEVFDVQYLPVYKDYIANYQLVRNILAVYEFNGHFYLFIDARRPDLAKSFYQTLRCVKDVELRNRCEVFYWQDVAFVAGADLQNFLSAKYGM